MFKRWRARLSLLTSDWWHFCIQNGLISLSSSFSQNAESIAISAGALLAVDIWLSSQAKPLDVLFFDADPVAVSVPVLAVDMLESDAETVSI